MSTGDRITILAAAGAVSATLGIGSCSTSARIGDVITQVNSRFDDINGRFDAVYRRLDAVDRRIDDLRAEIRDLRALIVGSRSNEPAR